MPDEPTPEVWVAWIHDGYGYGCNPDELIAVCSTQELAAHTCQQHLTNLGRSFLQPPHRGTLSEWRDYYDPEDADDPEADRYERTRFADGKDALGRTVHYRLERHPVVTPDA